MTRVRDLSEEQILERILPLLPLGGSTILGPGDDSAVVAAPDGRFVVSTDVLVADRHFRRHWSTGYDVGRRAAAQNFADIAAMGARPTAVVTSLVVPGDTGIEWLTGLARGLADGCAPVGAGAVGGDLSGGECLVVSVTVHGDLEGREPVLRSGARPGDVVAHAGVRGRSAAGLALLEAGLVRPEASGGSVSAELIEVADGVLLEDLWEPLVAAYLRPDPPLAAGIAAAAAGATSMLDLSDGLLRDAGRVAAASGVRVDLDAGAFAADRDALRSAARAVAVSAAEGAAAGGADALIDRWVWAGGEDHGLLATFPAGTQLPAGWSAVGQVHDADASSSVTIGGKVPDIGAGWDHFTG